MFNLIKKDKEKDGVRKDKKEKDKKERMSQAELKSLEEVGVRRGFFSLQRGGSKRESRAKLEISNPIPIQVVSNPELTLMDVTSERINNRSSMLLDVGRISTSSSSDNIKGENTQDFQRSSLREQATRPGSLTKQDSPVVKLIKRLSFSQKSKEESPSEGSVPSGSNSASPSPQAEPKLFHHVPKYISHRRAPLKQVQIPLLLDKTFPADLHLPAVIPAKVPEPRELELQRRKTGDFGFSLRRTTMLDQKPDGSVYRRMVHFAEPGAGNKDLALGLVPGDRLVEINGLNVENKNRDEIVEMIRQSGETVHLKVQPIVELSELSRCWLRNSTGVRGEAYEVRKHLLHVFM